MLFFAILIAKLLDPIMVIMALVAGTLSRTWGHAALAAIGIGVVMEMLIASMRFVIGFQPGSAVIGAIAAGMWISLVFWIRLYRARKRALEE